MKRTTVIAVAAGATIGYLAHEPSPESLLLSALVAIIGFLATRHLNAPGAAATNVPSSDALSEEMARARRFGTSLSLVAVRPLGTETFDHERLLAAAAIRFVDRALSDEGTTFLLLPQTNRQGAMAVAQRIESELGPSVVRVAVATFPDDAATGQGLIDAAVRQLDTDALRAPVRAADSVG